MIVWMVETGKRGYGSGRLDFFAAKRTKSYLASASSCALPDTSRLARLKRSSAQQRQKIFKSRITSVENNNINQFLHPSTPTTTPSWKFTATMPSKGASTKPASKKPTTTRSAISDVVAREYTIHLHKRVRKIISLMKSNSWPPSLSPEGGI